MATLAMVGMAGPVLAAGGGGGGAANACIWQQDISLAVGSTTLTVPQTVFDPKIPQSEIEGYMLFPNVERLALRIMTPAGDTWEAPLTMVGAKRCTGIFVGSAFLVERAYDPPLRVVRRPDAAH